MRNGVWKGERSNRQGRRTNQHNLEWLAVGGESEEWGPLPNRGELSSDPSVRRTGRVMDSGRAISNLRL